MYVWRFPVLLFAPFAVTAALLPVCAALLAWRETVTGRAARGVLLAVVAAMLFVSPALVSGTIDALTATEEPLKRMFVHPSPALLWAPAMIVPAVLVLLDRLFPLASAPRRTVLRYRAALLGTLIALGALNITNWCSPGWCERLGFPLPYSWWSDAILIMNGENWSAGFSALALLANVAAAALAALALSRAYRRALLIVCALAFSTYAAPPAVDPCTFGIPLEASGDVQLVVTLEESSNATADLPVIGSDAINRLFVPARIDEVRRGAFALPAGTRIGVAVHSIARTFGSDSRGERYVIGLAPGDSSGGYRVVSISPDEETRFQLRGTVVPGDGPADETTIVADQGGTYVRVRVTSIEGGGLRARKGDVVRLRIRTREAPTENQPICLFGLHRPSRADKPYRVLRIAH